MTRQELTAILDFDTVKAERDMLRGALEAIIEATDNDEYTAGVINQGRAALASLEGGA